MTEPDYVLPAGAERKVFPFSIFSTIFLSLERTLRTQASSLAPVCCANV